MMLDVLKYDGVSLRVLDWLVTNFAKNSQIMIGKMNIYVSYKNQLKAHTKKYFDPFCRRGRIKFEKMGVPISTTVGQLNFFKWAMTTGVLQFANDNRDVIESDMRSSIQKRSNTKKKQTRRLKHVPMYKPIKSAHVNTPTDVTRVIVKF